MGDLPAAARGWRQGLRARRAFRTFRQEWTGMHYIQYPLRTLLTLSEH